MKTFNSLDIVIKKMLYSKVCEFLFPYKTSLLIKLKSKEELKGLESIFLCVTHTLLLEAR